MARLARLGVLTSLALFAVCGPAAAVDRYVSMRGAPASGPAKYDRVWVQQLGPAGAERVLVLVPGTLGGATAQRLPEVGRVVPAARRPPLAPRAGGCG